MVLLASDAALDNQTEAVLQRFLDHNGKVTGALLVAIGGSRLCWMSLKQIQIIQPSEFRLAGAPDISLCPQSRKDALFAKAHEVFRNASSVGEYYYLMRPYLGEPCSVPPLPLCLLLIYPALCPARHPTHRSSGSLSVFL